MSDIGRREWRFYLEDMIDDDTLWSITRDEVPELLPMLKALKDKVNSAEGE